MLPYVFSFERSCQIKISVLLNKEYRYLKHYVIGQYRTNFTLLCLFVTCSVVYIT